MYLFPYPHFLENEYNRVSVPIDHSTAPQLPYICIYTFVSMEKIDFENYIDSVPKPNIEGGYTEGVEEDANVENVWKSASEILRTTIDKVQYNSWFTGVFLEDIRNGTAIFSCPNEFNRRRIEEDYKVLLKTALLKSTGQDLQLDFFIKHSSEDNKRNRYKYAQQESESIDLFTASENEQKRYQRALADSGLNPRYTFDNFIVGSHNRLAEAVAQAVVNEPGRAYNPVFIYGMTGVGKTHLMHAIGNELIKNNSSTKVVYVSIEQFLNEMIGAIQTRKTEDFRAKYRTVDLLIIDDVQFVETYPKTQEELFNTFNTLYHANKQIILASDRPPKEIRNITDRLRSRFEGGMVADIQPPDYETRVAILKHGMVEKKTTIPDDYVELIAKNIDSNVRELEGALNKVITLIKIGDNPTFEQVAKILKVDIESKRVKITPQKVIKSVSTVFDVSVTDIKGSRRTAYVALARQVVMYILRKELDLPLERVAKEVNRKDHTTVIHAYKQICEKVEKDSRFAEKIELCRRELTQ